MKKKSKRRPSKSKNHSACQILKDEPRRFGDYVRSNKQIRDSIYDKASFDIALRKVLMTDSSLKNILAGLKDEGDTLENCGQAVYDSPEVQNLVKNNVKVKKKELRDRVKSEYPTMKRGAVTREVNRRLKISIGVKESRVKKLKQVTIAGALRPVKVTGYTRAGQTIKEYRRSDARDLTKAEAMLIKNNINRPPADIIKIYSDSGLTFRSKTSLRRHIYRMRKKLTK